MNIRTAAVTSIEGHIGFRTLSGAHIRAVPDPEVRAFLARLTTPLLQPVRLALGAYEDNGALVGVLAITGPEAGVGTVHVVVVPERRQLRIGTDLVQALAAQPTEPSATPCDSAEPSAQMSPST